VSVLLLRVIRKDLITRMPHPLATAAKKATQLTLIRPPRQTEGQLQVGQIAMRRVEILVTPKVFVVGLVANKVA
jgi:hypothetical protein